jgi:uncharacterized protein YbaP (TraB family)
MTVRRTRASRARSVFGIAAWLLMMLSACAAPKPGVAPAPRASASAPSAPAVAGVAADTPGLFLYAVTGARGVSHLLGTMHVGFGFDEVLTAEAQARFRAAERVMLEADVSAADPASLMQNALLPPGQSLRALLGEPAWSTLTARLGPQIPPPVMDRLKPWLPAITLGMSEIEAALREIKPDAEGHMMDVELMRAAKAQNKALRYFETVGEQLAMFDAVPVNEQVSELRRSLSEGSGEQGRNMLRAFAAGDEVALTACLFDPEQLSQAPGFYEVVLYQRNARWLPVIEQELARGGAFIAVGAAHLLGERGILAELGRRGYRVERVGGAARARGTREQARAEPAPAAP